MTYLLSGIELVCPKCRSELIGPDEGCQLECTSCRARYPIVAGIPDLRVFPDPYISFRGDRVKGQMLERHFDAMRFSEICELYFDVTPEVPPHDVRTNLSRLVGGVSRAETAIASMEVPLGAPVEQVLGEGTWLEVGCGSAPLVAALAKRGIACVGVDVALRWLVIGRKRLLELGVEAPLVAACAEALPFRDGQFQMISYQHTLEVVQDQRSALLEAFRTSRGGGHLVVSTPNGRSLGPDPHVGVFGGAWLPWRVVSMLARLQMARPPWRRLLSAGALEEALRGAGWSDVSVTTPGVSASQRAQFTGLSRTMAGWYESARQRPGTAQLMKLIGPLLQATATRR